MFILFLLFAFNLAAQNLTNTGTKLSNVWAQASKPITGTATTNSGQPLANMTVQLLRNAATKAKQDAVEYTIKIRNMLGKTDFNSSDVKALNKRIEALTQYSDIIEKNLLLPDSELYRLDSLLPELKTKIDAIITEVNQILAINANLAQALTDLTPQDNSSPSPPSSGTGLGTLAGTTAVTAVTPTPPAPVGCIPCPAASTASECANAPGVCPK